MPFPCHCIAYIISSVCVPACTHFEASHFHSIVHTRLYLCCIHAYHAYCIVSGIGVSPGTGNEVHSVLRVTECVLIPQSPTLRIIHDGVRVGCVFIYIHFILSCTIWLLGHHASGCVIGGTRIEACIHLWKYIAMPLSCSPLQQIKNQQSSGAWHAFQEIIAKQRLIGASQWISAQGSPNLHHSSESRQSLACMPVYCFLS